MNHLNVYRLLYTYDRTDELVNIIDDMTSINPVCVAERIMNFELVCTAPIRLSGKIQDIQVQL